MHVPLKDTLTAKKSKIILSFVQYTLSISKTKISDLQPRQDDGHSRSLFHRRLESPTLDFELVKFLKIISTIPEAKPVVPFSHIQLQLIFPF